jgi:hypothetical protein
MAGENGVGIVGFDPVCNHAAFDVRIALADEARRQVGLAFADLTGGIERLSLKVGKLDAVVVDDREIANTNSQSSLGSHPAPMPPAPTTATLADFSLSCPAPPIWGRTMCRA